MSLDRAPLDDSNDIYNSYSVKKWTCAVMEFVASIEFFNSLDITGIRQHVLSLKIGAHIILLRNVNPPRMCNGTRLAVKKMMLKVIEATILKANQ